MTDRRSARGSTLAEKLDRLFKSGHPSGRGEYTYEEVAAGIKQLGLPPISPSYLWELRTGKKDNPRMQHLESIAAFFGITPADFYNEEAFDRIEARLGLLAALRDAGVEQLALNAADLSPETLRTITQLVERARQLEGLPPDAAHNETPGAEGERRRPETHEERRITARGPESQGKGQGT
jgi:transcriptional regulator with XRE-family HTH domain